MFSKISSSVTKEELDISSVIIFVTNSAIVSFLIIIEVTRRLPYRVGVKSIVFVVQPYTLLVLTRDLPSSRIKVSPITRILSPLMIGAFISGAVKR